MAITALVLALFLTDSNQITQLIEYSHTLLVYRFVNTPLPASKQKLEYKREELTSLCSQKSIRIYPTVSPFPVPIPEEEEEVEEKEEGEEEVKEEEERVEGKKEKSEKEEEKRGERREEVKEDEEEKEEEQEVEEEEEEKSMCSGYSDTQQCNQYKQL